MARPQPTAAPDDAPPADEEPIMRDGETEDTDPDDWEPDDEEGDDEPDTDDPEEEPEPVPTPAPRRRRPAAAPAVDPSAGLEKGVSVSSDDLFAAIGDYLDGRLRPMAEHLQELTKAVNAQTTATDTAADNFADLKKSLGETQTQFMELSKSLSGGITPGAPAAMKPAVQNTGAVVPDSTTSEALQPGDTLDKSMSGDPRANGGANKPAPAAGAPQGTPKPQVQNTRPEYKGW